MKLIFQRSNPMRSGTGSTARSGMIVGAMVLMGISGMANACNTVVGRGAERLLEFNVSNVIEPDVQLDAWRPVGGAPFLGGCTPGEKVPLDITATFPDLEFVRTVKLRTGGDPTVRDFPAYGLRGQPFSPLLVFYHNAWLGTADVLETALPANQRLSVKPAGSPQNFRGSGVYVTLFSRGGEMKEVLPVVLGAVKHESPNYKGLYKTDKPIVSVSFSEQRAGR